MGCEVAPSLRKMVFVFPCWGLFFAALAHPSILRGSGLQSGRVGEGGKCLNGARPGSKVGARPIAGLLPSTTAPASPCDRARAAHLSSVTRCCRRAPLARRRAPWACSKSATQNQHRSLSRASQVWRLLVPSSQLSGASALVCCPALSRLFGELHTAQTAARRWAARFATV